MFQDPQWMPETLDSPEPCAQLALHIHSFLLICAWSWLSVLLGEEMADVYAIEVYVETQRIFQMCFNN